MSDLKACPFCGRIPDIEDCGEHRWFIRCKCGIAQDKLFFQKCDAVRAWNKRKELRVKDTNVPIADTIGRQAALDALEWKWAGKAAIDAVMGEPSDAHYPTWYADIIRNLPSVQPEPEIVRCKDCFHYTLMPNGCNGQCDLQYTQVMYPWDFCSYGERRQDATS